jgi:hypothetical protein
MRACVRLSNARCYGGVTGPLFPAPSSRRSVARSRSGIWTPLVVDGLTLGSEPRNQPCVEVGPYRRKQRTWGRNPGARVRNPRSSLRWARNCRSTDETWVRRADVEARFTVSCPSNPAGSVSKARELGSEACVESMVSRNQTFGSRRQSVMSFTLGSEPRRVGSDDMGRYRSTHSRCLRNPKNCPTRARRSLQETASGVPIPGRRVPGAREWISQAGFWVRNPFACGPNVIARGRRPPAWVAKAFLCLREHGFSPAEAFRSPRNPCAQVGLGVS